MRQNFLQPRNIEPTSASPSSTGSSLPLDARLVEELTATVRLNDLLAGVLAHDLRNPLSAILTAADLALSNTSDERLVRTLSRIVKSGQRMSRMVEQFLDFARLRLGEGMPIEAAACDLEPLLRQVVEELDGAKTDAPIRVEQRGDTRGYWDADRLGQVFSNLLGNAIQHGAGGGVEVVVDGTHADEVRVRVHNRGAIPADLLPRLFQPLAGGQQRHAKARGLGLGLFITEAIVRAHGGQVDVDSSEATGTDFVVCLPRSAHREVSPRESSSGPPPVRDARERAFQSEQRMRLLIDSIREYAVFMLDEQGRISTWNLGAERMTGFRIDEVIGKHFSLFQLEEEVASGACERELARARDQLASETEGWRLRKDGSRFWASVVVNAIRDPGGQLVGYVELVRDLTERRRAEEKALESEQKFRLLVGSVRDYAIFTLDPEGRIQSWNAGARLCKGYLPEEILGRHISTFYTEEDRAAGLPARLLGQAVAEGRVEREGWRVRKDGSRFWADVVITAVFDSQGALRGFTKVTRDLTERRRQEQERLRLAQAEEGIRLRDEFLSIVSHELKTPLSGLQLQLEALQGQTGQPFNAKTRLRLARAVSSGGRLAALIESLLDTSRLATGRFSLSLSTFDFAQAVTEVVEGLRDAAGKAGCDLQIRRAPRDRGPIVGTWDRVRLEQVLLNLLSNALKYGAGQPVEVIVGSGPTEAVLQVRDRGPGLSPEGLERVFDRFERAASIRHYGGLGLGLFLVREIANVHGGSATAANLPQGGALFTVRLPRFPGGASTEPPPAASKGSP